LLFFNVFLCRKRATAEQLIKDYFYQLTDGCGVSGCSNENCASNGRLNLTRNEAAARALTLFHEKAQLCSNLVGNHHKGW